MQQWEETELHRLVKRVEVLEAESKVLIEWVRIAYRLIQFASSTGGWSASNLLDDKEVKHIAGID